MKTSFRLLTLAALVSIATAASAQISLATAVDLALRNSPRVKMAADDIAKARASLSEAKNVFVPAVSVGGGYGDSFGYTNNLPTLVTFTAQSLGFNFSQLDYIRSAQSGVAASTLQLAEARAAVAEDTVLTYAALQHDVQREAVLHDQDGYAKRLASITQDRFDAGQDARIDLHTARLTAAQIHLRVVSAAADTASDQAHLAALIGVATMASTLRVDPVFPATPSFDRDPGSSPMTPGIAAAFASAKAKQQVAWGDARYLYRPQIAPFFQYNRYATFSDSFKRIEQAYGSSIGANEEAFGVQFTIPLFDKGHQSKARESAADAAHAFHEAQSLQLAAAEGESKLARSLEILRARSEVATEERALAQDQLEALLAALNAPAQNGAPATTPKDEQNSRISERDKYLNVVDAEYAVRQAQINLLRQTGQLESWLRSSAQTVPAAVQP